MIVSVFASGSTGNCTLVSEGDTHILIDAGISMRRIRTALSAHALRLDQLSGIVITHEHTDHTNALEMLCKYTELPFFAPRTVANHIGRTMTGVERRFRHILPGEPFSLGELRVTAFPTPHDTDVSVGYRFDGSGSFGFCTDCGSVTEEMRGCLSGCGAIVIESNHDEEMLRTGPYPVMLKRRILSDHGHLSNADCAAFSVELARAGAQTLILGHLSQENNRPSLARAATEAALREAGFPAVRLEVAPVLGDLTVEVPCTEQLSLFDRRNRICSE